MVPPFGGDVSAGAGRIKLEPITVTIVGRDVEALKLASPPYDAVIELDPTGRAIVEYVPVPELSNVIEERVVPLS